jgi:hypothetical protein
MKLSHAEAHQLIQQSVDTPLPQDKEDLLDFHLQNCPDCGVYRNQINDVETVLRSTMNKHWSASPASFDADAITGKVKASPQGRLGTQLVMISLTIMLVMFGAWRLVNTSVIPATIAPLQISPIPTPSTLHARTLAPNCEEVVYTVQEGDTFAGIASRFSTTAEIIMDWNQIQPDALMVGNRISIPVCITPSATVHSTTLTLTFSPAPSITSSP